MFIKIDHIALHVNNIDASIEFYITIFGFTKFYEHNIPSGARIVYLKIGETILELSESIDSKISGSHFCLLTDNFDHDYNYLVNRIKLLQAIHPTSPRTLNEIGWKRAVFLGLDNEHIEIRGK